ncbi:MAG TPA: 23S rRNA (guanosine(2251)-2'-O)-methyltransferase RlmB [Actinomycetaceae bacterium]|nr:23S rRNA (guanosine(2251)-2'-O)-methyltransferase RlmB [Actinomycetaceae bacterium]
MAGNSRRRGAVRKPGSKKGATGGSGGKGRRGLQGRGPTPKATDRTGHPAAARKAAAERRAEAAPRRRGAGAERPAAREIVAGRNAVVELMEAHAPVERLYYAADPASDERLARAVELAGVRDVPLREATRSELDELADGAVHQGVLAQIPPYRYAQPGDLLDRAAERGEVPLIVVLDGITDPHNLGAVLRSAGAFGAHGVVVAQRRAAGVSAAVWKVSAGAAARVPVARATNLVRALQDYKKAGCFVAGLAGDGEGPVAELQLATEPLVVVIGSEDRGLSRLVRETCDTVVNIPITGVESLNAAVAAGIGLYQVAELRRTGH